MGQVKKKITDVPRQQVVGRVSAERNRTDVEHKTTSARRREDFPENNRSRRTKVK
jgi:hypothetical protein